MEEEVEDGRGKQTIPPAVVFEMKGIPVSLLVVAVVVVVVVQLIPFFLHGYNTRVVEGRQICYEEAYCNL